MLDVECAATVQGMGKVPHQDRPAQLQSRFPNKLRLRSHWRHQPGAECTENVVQQLNRGWNEFTSNSGGAGSGIYVSQVEYVGPYTRSAMFSNRLDTSHAVGIRITGSNAAKVNGILW